jgi:hypothetical protein
VPELAARIRADAATCEFTNIKDPQDEALRTRFMCSINNEAVLKVLFRMKDEDLTFAKAVAVAQETEEAARVAKETVYGRINTEVHKVSTNSQSLPGTRRGTDQKQLSYPKGTCWRCGTQNHTGSECPNVNDTCNHCQRQGHIESACLKKKRGIPPTEITRNQTCNNPSAISINHIAVTHQMEQSLSLNGHPVLFEVDTGAVDNFCSQDVWEEIGKPSLAPITLGYVGATGDSIPVLGAFQTPVTVPGHPAAQIMLRFNVVKLNLNLLGRDGIFKLNLDLTSLMNGRPESRKQFTVNTILEEAVYFKKQLQNGQPIRTRHAGLLPLPTRTAQNRPAGGATKSHVISYPVGTPCYARYCGSRRDEETRWVPAIVTKVHGSRSVNVRVYPRGPTWRRHPEQLRLRDGTEQDAGPGRDRHSADIMLTPRRETIIKTSAIGSTITSTNSSSISSSSNQSGDT